MVTQTVEPNALTRYITTARDNRMGSLRGAKTRRLENKHASIEIEWKGRAADYTMKIQHLVKEMPLTAKRETSMACSRWKGVAVNCKAPKNFFAVSAASVKTSRSVGGPSWHQALQIFSRSRWSGDEAKRLRIGVIHA